MRTKSNGYQNMTRDKPMLSTKGLKRATGDIIAFINSDDYYLPGTFNEVARVFTEY